MSRTKRKYYHTPSVYDEGSKIRDGIDGVDIPISNHKNQGDACFPGWSLESVWKRKTKKWAKRVRGKHARKEKKKDTSEE